MKQWSFQPSRQQEKNKKTKFYIYRGEQYHSFKLKTDKIIKHKEGMVIKMKIAGIDISKWQGDLNFTKVRDEGFDFAIIPRRKRNRGGSYV